MPRLLGYQTVRLDASPEQVENGRRSLAAFASREGYALGEVFCERDVNQPLSAFAAVIAAARRGGVVAVVVPTLEDLGRLPRVRQIMRQRLEREAGVRVLVVQGRA